MSLEVKIDSSTEATNGFTITKRHPSTGISVLIVGAGPVGVYTALEWSSDIQLRAHKNDRIAEDPWIAYQEINGERLAGPEGFSFRLKEGGGPKRMHRHNQPKFLRVLISQLQRLGIEIEYGLHAIDYYEDGNRQKAGAVFEDGRKLEADVVIAADGIGTKSHKLISGHDVRAWSSGWATARAVFPAEIIEADAELNERFKILDNGHPCIEMWQSRDIVTIMFEQRT